MSIEKRKLLHGMVSLGDPLNIENEIREYQELLNKKSDLVSRFISMEDKFPAEICRKIKKNGSQPMFTWLLNDYSKCGGHTRECLPHETGLDDILKGDFDSYFVEFAISAKSWSNTVYIRFLYEFNADWYVWSGYKNGADVGAPKKVKEVWKYIVNIFRSIGADNVKWIWCPHEPSCKVPLEEWNNIENYWPGDNYVDYMGIDGFNFYPENPERENPAFLTFDDLFQDTYNKLLSISDKPVFIMTGTGEYCHDSSISDKALWIRDAFDKINNKYTRIEMFFWFNFKFSDKADWRINSSEKSLQEYRKLVKV